MRWEVRCRGYILSYSSPRVIIFQYPFLHCLPLPRKMDDHPFCSTDSLVGSVVMSISCIPRLPPLFVLNLILAPNLTRRNYYCKMDQTTGLGMIVPRVWLYELTTMMMMTTIWHGNLLRRQWRSVAHSLWIDWRFMAQLLPLLLLRAIISLLYQSVSGSGSSRDCAVKQCCSTNQSQWHGHYSVICAFMPLRSRECKDRFPYPPSHSFLSYKCFRRDG